ncbi:MAG: ThiF family adenylyltransferase [Candidatus Paceibacterota bacterium]
MLPQVISLSPDLKQLWDEGFELEVKHGYLLVHNVPYVTSSKQIKSGTLVSTLDLAGEVTNNPQTHVIYFIGEYPCQKDGSPILAIQHQNGDQNLGNKIVVNYSFSNKPANGYPNYYEKIKRYFEIISNHAKSLNPDVEVKKYEVHLTEDEESVFHYSDTNSSRAKINALQEKLESQKIVIVGLGGTGSYILDLVAKTPVKEIHLFDGDEFLQHNAFRSPGAPSLEKLRERKKKVDYFAEVYSRMHKGIIPHAEFISSENINQLLDSHFVFLAIDGSQIKKELIEFCMNNKIPFVDVGMGLQLADNELVGIVRVTTGLLSKTDHLEKRISFSDESENAYASNIQIADLNSLNAALAVIKWKKIFSYYQDLGKECNSNYAINTGELFNEDFVV